MDDSATQPPHAGIEAPTAAQGDVSESSGDRSDHLADHHYTPLRVIEIVQTVLTALMLAFIFRAYFIEAFIIPTGSMASGLVGDHATRVCPTCGWEYDFGPTSSAHVGTDHVFRGGVRVRCPNCHDIAELDENQIVSKAGDRILVHKWPYLFAGPRRWDVVVFRDPSDPQQNFIKRLVGLPGEEIEIIDGDIYTRAADDSEPRIRRKTDVAQSALWTIVFDQNALPPPDPDDAARSLQWVPDLAETSISGQWAGYDTRVIRFESADAAPRRLRFAPVRSPYYFEDVHGYNGGPSSGDGSPPYVGDARVRFTLTPGSSEGTLAIELVRDTRRFVVLIDLAGRVSLEATSSDTPERHAIWESVKLPAFTPQRAIRVEFGHLDYRVYVKLDGVEVAASSDSQYEPNPFVLRGFKRTRPIGFELTGAGGEFELRDLRIDRDVHYAFSRNNTLRAYSGSPFELRGSEYFVLGDNTASSHDAREWYRVGPHLELDEESGRYRLGTVRDDQIVGQAFFVYLPGLLPIDAAGRFRLPDVGRVRFVR